MFVMVVPSPIFYDFYFKRRAKKDILAEINDLTEIDLGTEGYVNPLVHDSETDVEDGPSSKPTPKHDRSVVNSRTSPKELATLKQDNQLLKNKLAKAQKEVRTLEKTLKARNDDLIQHTEQQMPDTTTWNTRHPSQVIAIKALVDDGLLTDKTLQAAKESLDSHVAVTVLQQSAATATDRAELHDTNIQELRESDNYAFNARTALREWMKRLRILHHEELFLELGGP
jgi:hypothetical protein